MSTLDTFTFIKIMTLLLTSAEAHLTEWFAGSRAELSDSLPKPSLGNTHVNSAYDA